MAKGLKSISANNKLSYYTNEKNIPNQELVKETIQYFETGAGARAFKPLVFLNLFEKQYEFLKANFQDTEKVIKTLKGLPLNKIETHILFGLLLKWFGGYPVNNLNEDYDTTLKAIQKEFLNYEGETPEKDFCKVDNAEQRKFMKLGIAFTTAINNNIDVSQVLDVMPETQEKEYVSS